MPREQQQRFNEWKENQVTKEFLGAVKERIKGAIDNLLPSTNSHEYDMFMKGMIQAYNEILDVKLDMILEEINEDEI